MRSRATIATPTLLFAVLSSGSVGSAHGSDAFAFSSPIGSVVRKNSHVLPSSQALKSSSLLPRRLAKKEEEEVDVEMDPSVLDPSSYRRRPKILPADQPLHAAKNNDNHSDTSSFSILSWNILLPNSQDNWWCHKMYSPWVPDSARLWGHRQSLIRKRLLACDADIICLQEADGDTFDQDFDFMRAQQQQNSGGVGSGDCVGGSGGGYGHVLHKKFRFRCATFYKKDRFELEQVAHKDRTLVTTLRMRRKFSKDSNDGNCESSTTNSGGDLVGNSSDGRLVHVINCHLTGGAAPERRLRQVHEALDQIRKWKNGAANTLSRQRKAKRPSPKNIANGEDALRDLEEAAVVVCGDFNSDGNTGVRKLLVNGSVDPSWREQQYPAVPLTSKRREQPYSFIDAAELAYASNVCDGDYGENHVGAHGPACRPATYVVPHLASLLLSPININGQDRHDRTEFGHQVAKGLAATLSLQAFGDSEIEDAFESVDLDGNGFIDQDEVQQLLGSVFISLYGQQIEEEKRAFFDGFKDESREAGLTRMQFSDKLLALQRQVEEQSGLELTKGLMDTLGMRSYCENELSAAFRTVDLDGNNSIDEEEIETLLQGVYLATYGERIRREQKKFFGNFNDAMATNGGLKLDQFKERLLALQQELEGGSEGSELVEIKTEADAQRMIDRFTPKLRDALDQMFDYFCSGNDGESLSEDDVAKFLIRVNGQLGRGGTWHHTRAIFEKKREENSSVVLQVGLNRQEWYEVFARELGEGKWWQVVHDIEICGGNLRSNVKHDTQHYQGWLDYIYFDSRRLSCDCVQEALTDAELSRIYQDGDALPNEWHPSDHLPVAAVMSFLKERDR